MRVKNGFCQSAVTVPMSMNAPPAMSRDFRSCARVSRSCFIEMNGSALNNDLSGHVVMAGAALHRATEIKRTGFVCRDIHSHGIALNNRFIDAESRHGES